MKGWSGIKVLLITALVCLKTIVLSVTDPGDFAILDEFRKGLDNAELLQWPSGNQDPCGPPEWKFVYCKGSRVAQIQVQGMQLSGPLPPDFNKLTELTNIGLQKNKFNGKLPTFNGLSKLEYAYLGDNQFDTIPSDFFHGLTSLQVLSLDHSPLNKSTGWQIPPELENSGQLMNLSLIGCNVAGPIPDFLGRMASLTHLKLSYNKLTGGLPASFHGSSLQTLWLNNQIEAPTLTGPIDAIASMIMLTDAWLHGNSFTGPIPSAIGDCVSLKTLFLNGNQLVGLIPENLTTLPQLQSLKLENNMLMGPIPKVKFNFTYLPNSFCQATPGDACAPEVSALLDFLSAVNYPPKLASEWSGNDPCGSSWVGIACSSGKVSSINLPDWNLNGTISPSVGNLDGLLSIRLDRNNLTGAIPENLTSLKSLKMLNLSDNNLAAPLPKFDSGVTVLTVGNPLLDSPATTPVSPPENTPPSEDTHSTNPIPSSNTSPSANKGGSKSGNGGGNLPNGTTKSKLLIVMISTVIGVIIILSVVLCICIHLKRKKATVIAPGPIVANATVSSDSDHEVKVVLANDTHTSIASTEFQSSEKTGTTAAYMAYSGNIEISVEILRKVTDNFSPLNELGRGGFGVVYKGVLHDGTMIAVKRMEASVISNKALDEFESEIAVLSKVRHRNLVSLLGYSVEGNEKLLVYEYMPQGALSRILFHWKHLNLEPLSWKRRLSIALDVARAMEYLHNLANLSFIHRDLKPSNILLGDDFRAKVADFGLVKLAPDGKNSVVTRLAGTFGYLAPEYAVTGKVTTKVDVFSFGVVLMELVTGLMVIDEDRPEESRYLPSWFCQMKCSKERLVAAIDSALEVTEEIYESIFIVSELAGHCAAREPQQRPDMGYAVNMLAPLVEKWKPVREDQEEYLGIDLCQPLLQMVKGWKEAEGSTANSLRLDDSKGSIPAKPEGFAESFTSADGR